MSNPQLTSTPGQSGQPGKLSREAMELILAVTRHLAAPFDLPAMLAEVTSAACRVLDAERSSIWLMDRGGAELVLEVSADIGPVRLPLGQGLVGACARDGRLINVPDCYADARFDPAVDKRSGFTTRCSLTLPLLDHRSELVGVMQLLNKRGSVFDADDEALAEALAAQCAVALARVRMNAAMLEGEKMRQELELAREVQLHTLPAAMPLLPGYEMHGTFLPASLTGGDTYDLALIEQGLLIVLGDATGHGIAPALSVTQMHAMLRTAFRLGASLETAFRTVNNLLVEASVDGRFVTAFIGLMEPGSHRVRFLSGGQGPILHFHAQTLSCTSYRATSPPMGAMPLAALRPTVELELAPGDLLVLLTDGIYEFADASGAQFGRSRVEAVLREHHAGSTASLAQALLAAVHEFAGAAPQDDDITMVLLKRATEG